MSELLTSVTVMTGLAGLFGLLLAVAQRYLRVQEDPRLERVEAMLPGTNCGACGEPGCRSFAERLVAAETVPGKCSVSSQDQVQAIASFLDVEAGFQEKRVARLHCAGGTSSVRVLAEYRGVTSCRAAVVVNRGWRACPWGCLGLADCEVACGFGAITMNREALPVVDVDKCTACGDCVEACPLGLFTLEPLSHRVLVQCSAPLTGELARSVCRVACDACGRCAVDAPAGIIEMSGGLPQLREPTLAEESCTLRCPTGAIRWVEREQFTEVRRA